MTYLVDANILSEATRLSPDTRVVEWLSDHEREIVVDSIILGELYLGVLALPVGSRRTRLEHWFEAVTKTIVCLPWDTAVSRQWAKLVVALKRRGRPVPLLDGMIAATALEHGLTVATRNVSDFKNTGVKVVNPFD
ncbi:MAG TPA: PIN domain-containing protein [Planctomycetota bacterium]|nr:PIN domain-containing protein [Planctomycetota bacterium]